MKVNAVIVVLNLCVLFSCEKLYNPQVVNLSEKQYTKQQSDFVSIADVKKYFEKSYETKSDGEGYIIDVYRHKSTGDTLLYIVNTEFDGWKIVSSDRRTPAILAEGPRGSFSIEENPSVEMWIDCLAEDISKVRESADEELCFSDAEISANRNNWLQIKIEDAPMRDVAGHWEEYVTGSTEVYDSVKHFTPNWDQDKPYNQYCPLKPSSSSERAPAGCVAIAGAGVLYYLHNTFGVPEVMVSSGFCSGNTNGYTQHFDNASADVWDEMNESYTYSLSYLDLPEALMIAHVGMTIGMHYRSGYSWALPANLRTELFNGYGFNCSHGDYNENVVKESLANNMPVIVTATDLAIPIDFDIHCFVIDGYKRTRTKYTHHHYWVQDEFPPIGGPGELIIFDDPIHDHPSYETYSYSTPTITSIQINWGWASQWTSGINDGWYSLTGGWTVNNGKKYDYNHNRTMIYGFSLKE
ncbi:MAG: C10 family peptidase [Bacteroidales bacterium]|nr:C10 family peptidase [Bacteroidales bacterium]